MPQKTDDFCQTVFSTMHQAKYLYFEGEDCVLRRMHPSSLELEQIVIPESLRPLLLHLAHHLKMRGHPTGLACLHTFGGRITGR